MTPEPIATTTTTHPLPNFVVRSLARLQAEVNKETEELRAELHTLFGHDPRHPSTLNLTVNPPVLIVTHPALETPAEPAPDATVEPAPEVTP